MIDPVLTERGVTVYHGDNLAVLTGLDDCCVDAVITDPPYGLGNHSPAAVTTALTAWANGDRERVPDGRGFMGQEWDSFVPPPAVWDECLRVLKPGGHLACFAGSRTLDLMTLSVRMAGFEIRDTIAAWLYSSGFAKSLDVSRAIDRAASADREIIGPRARPDGSFRRLDIGGSAGASLAGSVDGALNTNGAMAVETAPATDDARRWDGWGTALAPAFEPIILARKPLIGTVAQTVLEHGTGGLNIAATRTAGVPPSVPQGRFGGSNDNRSTAGRNGEMSVPDPGGRWPKNVVLAHHPSCSDECHPDCHVRALDEQTAGQRAARPSGSHVRRNTTKWGDGVIYGEGTAVESAGHDGDQASRFFPTFRYEAKASASERPQVDGVAHPTVKPLALIGWLIRLLTPPGGTVLDPFGGSGTTGLAAAMQNHPAILVEQMPKPRQPVDPQHNPDYISLIRARLQRKPRTAAPGPSDGSLGGLFDTLTEDTA